MAYTQASPAFDLPRPNQACQVGALTAPSSGSIVAEEIGGNGIVRMTKLTLTNVPMTITRASSSAAGGGVQLYDFPKGAVIILGASAKLTLAGFTATSANAVGGLGTAQADSGATLASTEANVIASVAASAALTSGAGTFTGGSTGVAAPLGTATATDLWFNVATADDITSTRSGTVSGWVIVVWANCGDVTIA